jgi:hypothetical protein
MCLLFSITKREIYVLHWACAIQETMGRSVQWDLTLQKSIVPSRNIFRIIFISDFENMKTGDEA